MTEQPFDQQYLGYVDGEIRRLKRLADRTMVQFIFVRLTLVLVSASLPALTTLESHLPAIIASVVVAALAGLDTQFQWGEEWRHFRSTQLALERARRDFDRRKYLIDTGEAVQGVQSNADNVSIFSKEVETLLQSETDRFFKFRIAPWKKQTA